MPRDGNVVAVFRPLDGEIGFDRRRIFAMRDHGDRRVAENTVEDFRIVDEHVARRGAHEHLDAGGAFRIEPPDQFEIVVRRAEMERMIGERFFRRTRVFVSERGVVRRRRFRIRHLHETGDAAGDRGARLGEEIAFPFEPGFAKMDLIVDHAGNQQTSTGVEHAIVRSARQRWRDGVPLRPIADTPTSPWKRWPSLTMSAFTIQPNHSCLAVLSGARRVAASWHGKRYGHRIEPARAQRLTSCDPPQCE